jgi:hypothetical protein
MTIGLLVLGIIASTYGTGMLAQKANASECQDFISGPDVTKENCSSDNSFDHANNENIHFHIHNAK